MFSRTWLLTIKRNKARRDATIAHLESRGIAAEVFEGMDADSTGLETRLKYEVDNPRTGYRMGSKQVNLFLSHYMMWKCASYTTGDSFLFLEDDVRFHEDWRQHVASACANLPDDWDMLYLGSCCCADRPMVNIKNRLHKTEFALCTHAYAVRRKALSVLLDKCNRFWTGVDIEMVFNAFPYLNVYMLFPRIADQEGTVIAP